MRAIDLPLALRPLGYADEDLLLLYVPSPDSTGQRSVSLTGDPLCDPDPCLSTVTYGEPTDEKCPPPPASACATALPLPNGDKVSFASGSLNTTIAGLAGTTNYRGVIVASNNISISGTVRTSGRDLILLGTNLNAVGDAPTIDGSALRVAGTAAPLTGGQIKVIATNLNGPLTIKSLGGRAGLPSAFSFGQAIHWDCSSSPTDADPNCFPCFQPAAGYQDFVVQAAWQGGGYQCASVPDSTSLNYMVFGYPSSSASPLPESFLKAAPAGHTGGAAGSAYVLANSATAPTQIILGGGGWSHGLQGYSILWHDVFQCEDPYQATDIPACNIQVPDGTSPYGSDITGSAYSPSPGGDVSPESVAQLIANVSDQLIDADAQIASADRLFRQGNATDAQAAYQAALTLLGTDPNAYACSLQNAYLSAFGAVTGALSRIDAGLDYGGAAADWVPYSPPTLLAGNVAQEIGNVSAVGVALKLNALIQFDAVAQQAAINDALNKANGDLATREDSVLQLSLAEQTARLEELKQYVDAAQGDLSLLQKQLAGYIKQKTPSPSTSNWLVDVESVGKAAGGFFGAATAAYAAPGVGTLGAAATAGYGLYTALDSLKSDLSSGTEFNCTLDPTCVSYRQQVSVASTRLNAELSGLRAANYAVQGALANQKLSDARKNASADIATTYQDGHVEVASFSRLARAQKYLCEYGARLTDQAASTFFAYKRASALWDVPDAIANATTYSVNGVSYDYAFNTLLDAACTQPSGCSLWGDYNNFQQARLAQAPPNTATIYIGTDDNTKSHELGTLFHNVSALPGRIDVALDVFPSNDTLFFGARAAHPASGSPLLPPPGAASTLSRTAELAGIPVSPIPFGGAPALPVPKISFGTYPAILSALPLADKWAVQVTNIKVRAYGKIGKPVRATFPFRIFRPMTDIYRLPGTDGTEERYTMETPNTLDLKTGQGERMTQPTSEGGTFNFPIVDLSAPAPMLDHPESLTKGWVLSILLCDSKSTPSAECASVAEASAIDTAQIDVAVRYKAVPSTAAPGPIGRPLPPQR